MLDMYKGMVNSPETTITNDINAEDTIIYVLDETKVPEELPNLMTLGTGTSAETVKVLEVNGNALTVERGFQGVPRSWNAGTVIARNFTEYDYNALKENIETLDKEIGNLDNLSTEEKTSLVAAINEVDGKNAGNIEYDNTESGLSAENVQAAIDEVKDELDAHKAETIHQGKHSTLEATNTDDATSITNAPLKSAGGLAVAKSVYIGGSMYTRFTVREGQFISLANLEYQPIFSIQKPQSTQPSILNIDAFGYQQTIGAYALSLKVFISSSSVTVASSEFMGISDTDFIKIEHSDDSVICYIKTKSSTAPDSHRLVVTYLASTPKITWLI